MGNKYDIEKLEEDILDVERLSGTDIKINPDYYIHSAILKAQAALASDNLREGLLQFRILVEHTETLCRAGGMIRESYKKELETYKKEDKYDKEKDNLVKNALLANKKFELLLREVFEQKVGSQPLKA